MSEIARFVVSVVAVTVGVALVLTGVAEIVGALVALAGSYFAVQAVCDHADRKGLEAQVAKRAPLPQPRRRRIR